MPCEVVDGDLHRAHGLRAAGARAGPGAPEAARRSAARAAQQHRWVAAGRALPAHGAASRHMSRRPAGFPPSRRLLVRDRLIGWRRMQGMGRRRPVSGCEPRGPRRERRRAFRLFKQSIIAFSSNASGWSKLYAARPRPPLSAQQPAPATGNDGCRVASRYRQPSLGCAGSGTRPGECARRARVQAGSTVGRAGVAHRSRLLSRCSSGRGRSCPG